MSMEPLGFPQMGVGLQGGLQLVRDPNTGHLLLIHAAGENQLPLLYVYDKSIDTNLTVPSVLNRANAASHGLAKLHLRRRQRRSTLVAATTSRATGVSAATQRRWGWRAIGTNGEQRQQEEATERNADCENRG